MGGGLVGPHPPSRRFPRKKVVQVLRWVRRGANTADALKASGVPMATWYAWLKAADTGTWPDGDSLSPYARTFAARVRDGFARAQALAAVQAQQKVFAAADLPAREGMDWRAAHEWLKHADATRARWREHRELRIEHAGKVDHEHRLAAQLSDDQLLELAPAEWRELCEPLALPDHG